MLVLTLIIRHKFNTHYNRAQYKFPVPVQLMEVLKVVAVATLLLALQRPNKLAPVCMSYLREYLHVACIKWASQCQHYQLIVDNLLHLPLISNLTPTFSSQQS